MAIKEWCGGNCGMEDRCQGCKIDLNIRVRLIVKI